MRHFRSILYALVLAPAVWVLAATGLTHDLTARGRDGFAVGSLTGLVLVVLAGATYGILVFAPISPLGPVVAGVVFLGFGVWAVEWPSGYAGRWPGGVNDGFDLGRPGHGAAVLLAVPLILTALSVRRWSGFEPLVLPIIGTVGRARGAAAETESPMAVLPGFEADVEAERTTLIRLPGADVIAEATTVLFRPAADTSPDEGEETTALRVPAATADEQATGEVAAGTEEPTDTIADERPTEDVLDEPPTEVTPTETIPTEATPAENDEPTDVIADEPATEDVPGPPAEEPTVSLDDHAAELDDDDAELDDDDDAAEPEPELEAGAGEPAPTEAVEAAEVSSGEEPVATADDEPATDEEPGTSVSAATESGPPANEEAPETAALPGADSATPASSEETGDEAPPAEPVVSDSAEEWVSASSVGPGGAPAGDEDDEEVVLVEETTYLLVPAGDDARTQAIQLAAELEADGERTQVIRPVGYEPGLATRELGTPGDRTQVIWPANRRAPGETTQVIGGPGEQTRRIVRSGEIGRSGEKVAGRDEHQPIRVPDNGARTQVIRSGHVTAPGGGLQPHPVAPPADHVELMRLPRQRTDPDENPAELTQLLGGEPEPAAPSIARAESPNFAEDPTGLIVPVTLPPDEPTRTMTVMNIERPPDETPEIPSQRKPPAED